MINSKDLTVLADSENASGFIVGELVTLSSGESKRMIEGVERELGKPPYQVSGSTYFPGSNITLIKIRGSNGMETSLERSHLSEYSTPSSQSNL